MMSVVAFVLVYLVRPALTVVWIALAIIQFCLCLKKRKILPMFGIIIMLLAGMQVQKQVLNYIGEKTDVIVDNGMPVVPLMIAMGMQGWDRFGFGVGSYNAYNWFTFAESGWDREEAARRGWENISESLRLWMKSPRIMCGHLFLKTVNQWTEPGYDAFTMTCSMEDPKGWVKDLYYGRSHEIIYTVLDCFQTFCFFLQTVWFLHLFKTEAKGIEKTQPQDYLIGLVLIGGFFFSLLWEASCRYIFPYMVIAIPCAAGSFAHLINKFVDFINKNVYNL